MIFIDVLTHVFPRSYRRAAERVIPNLGQKYPFTREPLLTDLDMRLVANPPRSVQVIALPVIEEAEKTMGTHTFETANQELAQTVLDHPELFIGALARLDMADAAWSAGYVADTIARSDSLVGIELLTREQGLPLTDASFAPIFQAIDASRRPVFVHPLSHSRDMASCRQQWAGQLSRMLEDLASSTLLANNPHLRLVLHGGALLDRQTLADALSHLSGKGADRLYVDTALAGSTQISTAAQVLGADHLLFSSEAPFASNGGDPLDMETAAMEAVRAADLGERQTQAVLGGTLAAIRRSLPVNVKSEEDTYKEDKAVAERRQAEEDERRARQLDEQDDATEASQA